MVPSCSNILPEAGGTERAGAALDPTFDEKNPEVA
jgi:hypothetical protein